MAACNELYNALLDGVNHMHRTKAITFGQAEVIRGELRDAMWHSGSTQETLHALSALALHYDLPMPADASIDDLPFNFPDTEETPTLTKLYPVPGNARFMPDVWRWATRIAASMRMQKGAQSMTAGKECNICHKWRRIEQYGTYAQNGKRYLRGDCKACCSVRQARRYKEKKAMVGFIEKKRAYERDLYRKHQPSRRAKCNARYAANAEQVVIRQRRYRRLKAMRKAGLSP